ncbi:hypothetical protein CP533_0302 [Ophiocordyceps camponoti-saundersi (nom. inval.)]|nr:hypothetical protein CP533_0302 [Ophiocordyceps camponoti-saundersi (nom. inval.)]
MEAKKVIDNVQGIYGGQSTHGILRLTDFHLVFCAPAKQPEGAKSESSSTRNRERWLTYPILCYCALRPTPPSSRIAPSIRIRCRDFTFVTFNFADNDAARQAFDFIYTRTCKLGSVERLFAFNHKPLASEKGLNGWEIYDPRAEFRRQGISEKLPDKGWRITNINKDYTFCDTYPAVLVVPSKISDNVLKYARDFRSRNRIPVLSYIHPVNNCTITRSSQPLSGITRKSNVQDEKLVAASFSAWMPGGSDEPTPPSSQSEASTVEPDLPETERYEDELISRSAAALYDEKTGEQLVYGRQQANMIVDARPTINAIVNQVQGMGSENMDKYTFATKSFLNIENIHVMRNSLIKVNEALKDADISPLPPNRELLQQSGWLRHIYSVLDGSAIIARRIGINHSHVLIHCSDGWDRTSQLSALAQIMLDPYYRTLEGFIVLVEKDWLSFGHMFRLRSGHLNHDDWFTVQKDALAGSKVHPGDGDGRNDALQNVLSGAKRFFNQSRDDADLSSISEAASGKVVDEEATLPKMVSPVFHQFLDCTYQLVCQNPDRFEFNERFLRRLLYHLYSCQYGTFLYNSEKQRRDARLSERTSSVWDYFLCRKAEFTNPSYDAVIDDRERGRERILLPNLNDIRWWHQLFGRADDDMNGSLNANSKPAANESSKFEAGPSVLVAVETAHDTLTPGPRQAPPSSSSNVLSAALRDGFSSLDISRGAEPADAPTPPRSEQELQEMT